MEFDLRIHCGELSAQDAGREVHVAGWVDAVRDHGELLFIHLRDRSGIVQVVFNPEFSPNELCERAGKLRSEACVAVTGEVRVRQPGTENPLIATGGIEVMASGLEVLAASAPLPFEISEKAMVAGGASTAATNVAEDLRLQYRYLDLRRPSMQDNFMKRHRINKVVRDYLDEQGFIEVETPMLTKSTPEGARDYLVPSRVHPERFYALPQSPQLFKQLLMLSGFERYFQIARCFRDEDLRPNRQPEFTQLDLEASFVDEEAVYELVEELTVRMFAVGGMELPRPFPRMTWQEAMDLTGSDRPDLRFGMGFVDATDVFVHTEYGIFQRILEQGGCIKGINARAMSDRLSKNVLQNEYAKEIVPGFGAKGMTWMRVADGRLESNIVQFFSEEEQRGLLERFQAEDGDVIMMIADADWSVVVSALGQLRLHLARRLGLIPADVYRPVWVTEFPLFEPSEDWVTSSHHPFTAPDRTDFDPASKDDLLALRSRAYDLVMNGEELGGGSIRISDKALQYRIFRALRLSEPEIEAKFGFFLRAFDFGAPPHGGLALGMDRVISMILGKSSIREVIAFPKNRSAYCPLTEAPSRVTREQLAELHLLDLKVGGRGYQLVQEQDRLESLAWVSRMGLVECERPALEEALDEAARMAEVVDQHAGPEEPLFGVAVGTSQFRAGTEARMSELAQEDKLLQNAPETKDHFFKVASVLE
jgi:aspartyl-tRNA synthetase